MEVPGPETVRAAFAGETLEDARFSRDGDAYVIDDAQGRHRVRYTFGVEPLQQVLVDGPGGRLRAYPLAWDTTRGAWFRVTDADLPARYQAWNTMCAECHSTGVDKGYDAEADRFATRFEDVDVGCQACHGPGLRHAQDPTQPLPARSDVEACAPCHARRSAIAARGDTFFDRYRPLLLHDGLYHPDGQILDEVFEYGSFAQSLMHDRGVRCVDCHDPHSGAVAAGNAVCTQCHNAAPSPRFPTLATRARNVDTPAHHHHTEGSPGASCIACHMPTRTYMKNDVRHDHSFRIPRPDLAVSLGTPDPCTLSCHADRDAVWSAATVAQWFPGPKPRHFGETFARARRGAASADELRAIALGPALPTSDRPPHSLTGNAARSGTAGAFVRATAFELLARFPAACVDAAATGLADPSPLVRSTAVACGEALPLAARPAFARAALRDPVRLVRIEAARVLAGSPIDDADRAAFRAARRELEDAYRMDLDRPEGWYNLAALAHAEARTRDAIALLERALALDPNYEPARDSLRALAR